MRRILGEMLIALIWICAPAYGADHAHKAPVVDATDKAELVSPRITPDEAFEQMKAGNLRFAADKAIHPHTDLSRLKQAGTESQGNHAFATVLTCSDSRIPVERIFDAGIMDIFVVRVAGNVCNSDQAGSIEYGLAHVNTPLLVVMGHTQCGAVTAVAQALQGKAHTLERNIPGMIASIQPAVKRVMQSEEGMNGKNLIDKAIEENVWQAIESLFLCSPRTRELVTTDKVKVVAAVYDVGTGRVRWLPDSKVYRLLGRTESDPKRAINAFADDGHEPHASAPKVSTIRAVAEHGAEPAHGEKPHGKETDHSHGAAKPVDPHKEAPAADTKKKPAPAEKKVAEKSGHGDKADDKHGHGDQEDDKHGHAAKDKEDDKHGAAKDDDKEDDHAEAAPAAPAKSKPWMLIGIAGGILVAGVVLMLMAMKGSKAAAATAAAGAAADAHGHAPAAH